MYITWSDVAMRYPILATWVGSTTWINSDLIYHAERDVLGQLASHYTVPFSAGHPTVVDLCIDWTYYKALVVKDPEKAEKLRESLAGRLDRLKKGEEVIFTGSYTTITPLPTGGEVWSSTKDYAPVFSMLDVENEFTQVDSQRLYDEEGQRS